MKVMIPVYVQELKGEEGKVYAARPVFFDAPAERGDNLRRVITRLVGVLRGDFELLGTAAHHERLAAYTFCPPDLEDHFYKLTLDLRQRTAQARFLVVAFHALDRKVGFTPSLPDLWFEVARGETLKARAAEALTRHFRDLERRDGKDAARPEDFSVDGKAWVEMVELSFQPPTLARELKPSPFALLGGQEIMSGAWELRKVGRCLDWLYPDELDRVVCRDAEVEELTRLLHARDRRPVLLVGPRLAGKTALIHEYVYQTVARRRSAYTAGRNVWLLSPQRLISGMSYVGQWENRLLAIIKEAARHNLTLYFDDLLGMFQAGVSRDSDLNVAQVLKPYVEKRRFRLLAEITPEAWRVLREQDRSFADLFHVLPVNPTGEDETLKILIHLMRLLEDGHGCRFDLEVIPTVLELQRRYGRDAAFPGKGALFLRQLAVKYRGAKITRDNVLAEFQAKSGMRVAFLDSRVALAHKEVIEALGREVIGQPAALEAAADVVCIAKARLNDPDRPLASFLFLGPTGVGKTQCAKSLAAHLFGDADRILRFDMNEFVSPASVARLVGTFNNPEGLLTSAIRRQPFAVVLLDEIEKADPDVFNLLLQVMGEGRLSDALGRTADFTNAILILTSNLGVREAAGNLGFRRGQSRAGSVYRQAAEKFFKPEFFNRLDRIVPFERLDRDDVRRIARGLIQGVFGREGLLRRRCILQVDERAMERIVDQGYHPTLGARALKRAIERQLTEPVAERLATFNVETPTVVKVTPGGDGIKVHVQALAQAEPGPASVATLNLSDGRGVVEGVLAVLARVEEEITHLRPEGRISLDAVAPEHYRYFAVMELMQRVRALAQRAEDDLRRPAPPGRKGPRLRPRHLVVRDGYDMGTRQELRGLDIIRDETRGDEADAGPPEVSPRRLVARAADRRVDLWVMLDGVIAAADTRNRLRQLAAAATPHGREREDYLADLAREAALLDLLAAAHRRGEDGRALVLVRPLFEAEETWRVALRDLYVELFGRHFDLEVIEIRGAEGGEALLLSGPHALPLARVEEGTHLFYPRRDHLVPVQVTVLACGVGDEPLAVLQSHLDARRQGFARISEGEAAPDDEAFNLRPVIRMYEEDGMTLDLRTGLMTAGMPPAGDLRTFILSALPAPPELNR